MSFKKNILTGELPKLVLDHVITQENADAILRYYEKKEGRPQSFILLISFGVLGAVLVGGGFILLLAHNWHELSRALRTVISLLPLVVAQGLCLYAIVKRGGSIAWRESASAFLVLSIGIAISLISQTYNIYGDFGRFVLTWTLLSIPAVYLMNSSFTAVLCLAGIAAWAGYKANGNECPYLFWPLCASILPYGYYLYIKLNESVRFRLLVWASVIFFSISLNFIFTPWVYHVSHQSFNLPGFSFLAYSALYSILYLIGRSRFYHEKNIASNPCLIFGSLGIPAHALFYTFAHSWEYYKTFHVKNGIAFTGALWFNIIVLAILILGACALLAIRVRQKSSYAVPWGAYLPVAIAGYVLSISGAPAWINLILFNLYLFVTGVFTVVRGVRDLSLATVNFGMLILASQTITRFFDSELSFITRGIVFIVFGTGFLLVNALIVKKRRDS